MIAVRTAEHGTMLWGSPAFFRGIGWELFDVKLVGSHARAIGFCL
jgi:hypothetical protein